jgi:hypothetical protein
MWVLLVAACVHPVVPPEVAVTRARVVVQQQRGWGDSEEATFRAERYAFGRWTVVASAPSWIGEEVVVLVGEHDVSLYEDR